MADASTSNQQISSIDSHPRKKVPILDTEMSYVDTGHGEPIVFLHGNPTSSYLWRNIIPYVNDLGRCFAPDLVGMGHSGKSPKGSYRFIDHAKYLDAWFEALNLTRDVTLVIHDWGGALGLHRATRYPNQIRAIAYMEVVLPTSWTNFGAAGEMFRGLRSPNGEQMVLEQNFFVEGILPRAILRKLSREEMDAYRAPFAKREDRLPTLIWPRQIPIDGEPADVAAITTGYAKAMAQSQIPKLLIVGEPGAIIRGLALESCRTWPNQREVAVKGIHFLQEDSPHEIGEALREFVKSLGNADV